jgi:hypothetical protein
MAHRVTVSNDLRIARRARALAAAATDVSTSRLVTAKRNGTGCTERFEVGQIAVYRVIT